MTTTQPYITVDEETHQKMMEPRAQRSESVYERVKKEGMCSGYMVYLVAVGVVFCSVMLGIVVWGDVIAKQNDPAINSDTHLLIDPKTGTPLKIQDDTTFAGLPETYDSANWYQVQKVGATFPGGVQAKHTVSGIEINDDAKATTIYTPNPNVFFRYNENETGTLFEYYSPSGKTGSCSIQNMACVSISDGRVAERRRLQGSLSGGINNDGSGWSGNVSGNQNFGNGWSGTAGGGFHQDGGWNANAGVGWTSSSGNGNFNAGVSTSSNGGYQAGVSFGFKW